MNRLFLKIFISFWLITIAVVLAMLATSRYIAELEKNPQPSAYELGKAAQGILSRTADIARDRSPKELELWLQGLPSIHSVKAYSINLEDPRRSTAVPEEVRLAAQALTLSQPKLVTEISTASLYGQLLIRDGTAISKLLIATPLPPSPIVYFFTKYIWVRLLAAVIVSGLICFFMARAITRPFVDLTKATQQLGNGNLNYRFDAGNYSNDEISDLGYEFNNMAERLQQTLEEQKQLVRDISHELRSPLGRIQAALALAERKDGDNSAELVRVEKECERLNNMVNKLLVIPNYNQALDDVIDLVALVYDIANDDELEAEQANKSISVKTDCKELLIHTAGNLLWHAVDNLTRNALRYTPEGTAIDIILKLDNANQAISLTVRDQGSGVPEESLDKIFKDFYRVESAREHQKSGGHGLGLSIANRAVIHHDGKMTARNLATGFEIEINLPSSLIVEGK